MIRSAPFSDAQVESINGFQRSGVMHPFTCPVDDPVHSVDSHLVATPAGMHCPADGCEYRQDWVHEFMADGQWRDGARQLAELGFRVVLDTPPL